VGNVESSVLVDAFVPRVFSFLWPEKVGAWYASANGTRVEVVSAGGMGPGARLRISGESRFGRSAYEAEVLEWEPPNAFAWRVVGGAPPGEVGLRCEAEGKRTRVTMRHRYAVRPPLIGALLDRWLVRPRVEAVDREAVENLKALAEGRRGCP
jgi:uncharacterized protein YndB with AHSA1/START domain